MTARPSPAAARGFTLVELMVALAIGLVLTVVVAQLFIGSRETFRTTDAVSRLQENMRYSYQLMTRIVHLGGYKAAPNTLVDSVFGPGTPAIGGVDGATAADSDSFSVSYQGGSNGSDPAANGSITDCLGTPVAATATAVNTFTIGLGSNGANALLCNGTEIVADVENMQVDYGVDVNSDAVVDTYGPAGIVANMDQVRSVRVALLFSSEDATATPTASTLTYNLNGVVLGPYNDRRVRRAVTMTFNMRNRTP